VISIIGLRCLSAPSNDRTTIYTQLCGFRALPEKPEKDYSSRSYLPRPPAYYFNNRKLRADSNTRQPVSVRSEVKLFAH
jgi:hypothetical protein